MAWGAKDCSLKVLASVDILPDNSGLIRIPVQVDGQDRQMILDTGAFWSGILQSAVPQAKSFRSGVMAIGAGGGIADRGISVPEFRIGGLIFHDADFMVLQGVFTSSTEVIGNIGANILKDYDVEVDQAARKVNIISQDHCDGHVVHWAFTDLVKIPFDLAKDGRLTIPVTLDGKKLDALVDTGATASQLRIDLSKDLFGLSPDGPGMEKAGVVVGIGGQRMQQYEHRFDSLSMEGITFKNANIMIAESDIPKATPGFKNGGMPEFVLGMHQLRNLHLYFAYGEETLYASTVAGDAAAAGTTPAAVPVPPVDPVDAINAAKLNESALKHATAGEYQAAMADFASALAITPGAAWLYVSRASIHVRMKNTDLALRDYTQAIRIDPNLQSAYLGRADLFSQGGDLDAAIADLSKGIAISPLSAIQPLMLRCRLYATRQEFAAALFDCNQAVIFSPRQAAPLEMRGAVRLAAGQIADALDDFDEALRLDPHRAHALLGRGLVRQRTGDAAGARADMAAAEAIYPSVKADFAKLLQSDKAAGRTAR